MTTFIQGGLKRWSLATLVSLLCVAQGRNGAMLGFKSALSISVHARKGGTINRRGDFLPRRQKLDMTTFMQGGLKRWRLAT